MKTSKFIKPAMLLCAALLLHTFAQAQTQTASVSINAATTHQKITGFGGFVNSPQFAYGAMSNVEIAKVWGKGSELKCNIMRLYIPTGSTTNPESSWSQAVTTAQYAKSLGLIVFASPWSMPAAWKSSNNTTGGSLNTANYGDYANYLNRFVTLMHTNGVELDAISIQNEPDANVTYASCSWTGAQIVSFLTQYRSAINCKVIAPETMNIGSSAYVTALTASNAINQYDIYGGHQYGWNGTPASISAISAKGKEIWMTEYLLNWASSSTALTDVQPFSWASQGFDFAKSINTCMLADISAWIHYAAKRYYGMIGDGYGGTVNGEITKRGYILAHYSKYVTGATRIESAFRDATLYGSSYLSVTGDSVIVVVMNPSNNPYSLTVNLPFNTTTGESITTTETANLAEAAINLPAATATPAVGISASSVTTLIFTKTGIGASITQVKDETVVVSEEYYTPSGQRIYPSNNNLKGIYIVKSLMSDGSVRTKKVIY